MDDVGTMNRRRAKTQTCARESVMAAELEGESVSVHLPVAKEKRLIRISRVEALTGLKKSHIYGLMRDGRFPRKVVLSRRCVAFVESEILAWVDARMAERGQA